MLDVCGCVMFCVDVCTAYPFSVFVFVRVLCCVEVCLFLFVRVYAVLCGRVRCKRVCIHVCTCMQKGI